MFSDSFFGLSEKKPLVCFLLSHPPLQHNPPHIQFHLPSAALRGRWKGHQHVFVGETAYATFLVCYHFIKNMHTFAFINWAQKHITQYFKGIINSLLKYVKLGKWVDQMCLSVVENLLQNCKDYIIRLLYYVQFEKAVPKRLSYNILKVKGCVSLRFRAPERLSISSLKWGQLHKIPLIIHSYRFWGSQKINTC